MTAKRPRETYLEYLTLAVDAMVFRTLFTALVITSAVAAVFPLAALFALTELGVLSLSFSWLIVTAVIAQSVWYIIVDYPVVGVLREHTDILAV